MSRNKRSRKYQAMCFVFTPETIKLTEEALTLFDQPLQRADHRDTKVRFAEETMKRVRGKLDAMKKSVGFMCLTTFDYNEKVVLAQALRLYSIDLSFSPVDERQARKIRQCRRIAAYFEAENARAQRKRSDI
jgi:hypothetical protein